MHCYPGVAETNLRGPAEEVKAKLEYSKGDREHSLRVDTLPMEAEFASGFQVMHGFSSSDIDNHYEPSKDDGCLEKTHDVTGKPSLDAVTGLQESVLSDCYLSNDSRINATKTELEDIKGNTYDHPLSPAGYKGWNTDTVSSLN